MKIVLSKQDKANAIIIKRKSIKVGSVLLAGLVTFSQVAFECGSQTTKQIIKEIKS
jgi:hypothetical protein